MARAEIDKIANNASAPTFNNTIIELEKSGAALNRAATMFFVHAGNLNKGPIPGAC